MSVRLIVAICATIGFFAIFGYLLGFVGGIEWERKNHD